MCEGDGFSLFYGQRCELKLMSREEEKREGECATLCWRDGDTDSCALSHQVLIEAYMKA